MKQKIENELYILNNIVANKDLPFDERAAASEKVLLLEKDKTIISGMESDLSFAIEWMITARHPGSKRGIERRSSAQRTKIIDPYLLQTFFSGDQDVYCWEERTEENKSDKKKFDVERALAVLTKKQKELFLMIRGQGLTIVETARTLKISKQAAQQGLVRAERKLGEYIASLEGAE